jgi:hypothetical protein
VEQPGAGPLRSLFQHNGAAGAARGGAGAGAGVAAGARAQRAIGAISVRSPRVGAALLIAAQVAAATAPVALPAVGLLFASGAALEVHRGVDGLHRIGESLQATQEAVHTATHATTGEAYIESVGPGLQAATRLARSVDESHLVATLSQLDVQALSSVLRQLSAVDLPQLARTWQEAFEELQNLSVQASVRFAPAAGDGVG